MKRNRKLFHLVLVGCFLLFASQSAFASASQSVYPDMEWENSAYGCTSCVTLGDGSVRITSPTSETTGYSIGTAYVENAERIYIDYSYEFTNYSIQNDLDISMYVSAGGNTWQVYDSTSLSPPNTYTDENGRSAVLDTYGYTGPIEIYIEVHAQGADSNFAAASIDDIRYE